MRRDWSLARSKVEAEGRCRVCGQTSSLEAAHVCGQKYDSADGIVRPVDVVPLCSRKPSGAGGCHQAYDSHDLDLLPYLSLEEQAWAAGHLGLVRALARTTGRRV